MKFWTIPLLPLLLNGCATTDVAHLTSGKPETGTSTIRIVWQVPDAAEIRKDGQFPNIAEIRLDGKRYAGKWSDGRCFTPQCRGEFRSVLKIHRQHIRRGSAELVASDNTRLSCEWVSHHKKVIGTCQAGDGRKFKLTEA